MILSIPKHFNGGGGINDFIRSSSIYFQNKGKKEKSFVLNVAKVKDISLLGQLLLYKFVSFTAENDCFLSPTIKGLDSFYLQQELKKSGFYDLIDTYINRPKDKNALNKSYNQLRIKNEDGLLIAPQKLLRESINERSLIETKYLTQLYDFYSKYGNKGRTIGFCVAELLSNFWAHATTDTGTIMVVRGSKYSIEICFADTGDGIINNLRGSSDQFKRLSDKEMLLKALDKNVTSKPNSNHAGLGLYLIKTIVNHSRDSVFDIYSNSVNYRLRGSTKEVVKGSGTWKGTITYLRFNVDNISSMDCIEELKTDTYNRINWR